MKAYVLVVAMAAMGAAGCSDGGAGAPEPMEDSGEDDGMTMVDATFVTVDVPTTPADAAVTAIALETQVYASNCAISGCHVGPGPAGNLDLSAGHSRAQLVNVHSSGSQCGGISAIRVIPGDPAHSLLVQKLSETMPPCGAQMPLGLTPLPTATINLIVAWIDAGAP